MLSCQSSLHSICQPDINKLCDIQIAENLALHRLTAKIPLVQRQVSSKVTMPR